MRFTHFFAGLTLFGLGLFLTYMYSPLVVEFIKGALQPVTVLLGLLALLSVVFNKTTHKTINLVVAIVLLTVGAYGFWDEYLAVKDLFYGGGPVVLIVFGLIAVIHGVRSLT